MILHILSSLLHSFFIQSALLSWFIAQLIKTIIAFVKHGNLNLERMVGSGGFPSSHTALVAALTTAIGLQEGLQSSSFAIALVFSLIVMYDASGVRLAAGRQAAILNQLIRHFAERKIQLKGDGKLLKELIGHTPFEVFGGILLGIAIAVSLYFLSI